MNAQPHDIAALESLLAFWRDAGVDACYGEAPVDHTHIAPPPAVKAIQRATASVVAPHAGRDAGDALAEARRLASSAATLQDLAAAVAAFEGCPLRELGATQSVFGRGTPAAKVLVIGEAPGSQEDKEGRPFVGQAGQLLDKMLAAAGLIDQAFIINTVFWRPPGNRSPSPQEQAVCAPFVERAFQLIEPKAVLLLGATSAKAVLQSEEPIMRLRGQWKEWRLAEGGFSAPAVATIHPAFLLRQPQAKRLVWADFLALAAKVDGSG